MSGCAVAAYHTVPEDFVLDGLHAHFVGGADNKKPMQYKVVRSSSGRRFAVRSVTIEQDRRTLITATVQFVNGAPWNGPAMAYSVPRQTDHIIPQITLDDLEPGRNRLGPFMRFQRLPLVFRGLTLHQGSSPSQLTLNRCHQIPCLGNLIVSSPNHPADC